MWSMMISTCSARCSFCLRPTVLTSRTFKSGAALLKDAASDDADCFVIDYKMPNMNGIDLARPPAKPGYFGRPSS